MVFFSTSSAEAFLRVSRRNQRLLAAKWCVPGGVKTADDGSSAPVERILDLIAFLVLL
jgi:hypothetical protein